MATVEGAVGGKEEEGEQGGKGEEGEAFPEGWGRFRLLLLECGAGVVVMVMVVVAAMVVLPEERGVAVAGEGCTAGGLGGKGARFFLAPVRQQRRARIPVRAGGSPGPVASFPKQPAPAVHARWVSLEMAG